MEDRITMSDGITLSVRRHEPEQTQATRTLLWCHGIGEHGGKHQHVIDEYVARGWRVILPDLRGHGVSEGLRTDVKTFERYLLDFDRLVEHYEIQPLRTALYGHSMGGLVMTRYVQTRHQPWAALVLSAPLLGVAVPIPHWKWWLGKFLAKVAPRTHLRTGIREDNLTRDPEFLRKRRADPLIQKSVTVRWFFTMLKTVQKAHRDAARIQLPVLIVQGMLDRTTDSAIPEQWLARVSSTDKQFIGYPDGLHEMLNDTKWRTVLAAIMDWLDRRIPG